MLFILNTYILIECKPNTYGARRGYVHGCESCPANAVTTYNNGLPAISKKACVCAVGYDGIPEYNKPCIRKFKYLLLFAT